METRYKSTIVCKLKAEQATNLSDTTLENTFNPTVGGPKLTEIAKQLRDSGNITVFDIY